MHVDGEVPGPAKADFTKWGVEVIQVEESSPSVVLAVGDVGAVEELARRARYEGVQHESREVHYKGEERRESVEATQVDDRDVAAALELAGEKEVGGEEGAQEEESVH